MLPFDAIVELLPYVAPAKYRQPGQVPSPVAGVNLNSSYIGNDFTNCTMFTAWLVSEVFDKAFESGQWGQWQVYDKDPEGYGPGVVHDWRAGYIAPEKMNPVTGVWLVQYFTEWPKGHSMLVVDWHAETGKILTLEANTKNTGLDGVGWGGIGAIRDVPNPGPNWHHKTKQTWAGRCGPDREVYMTRLYIDANSVRNWLERG